ncbi:YraN family protein [Hymenobacter sp. 15J16-1T3B]|uniref:YraN family protein n=1 Tax=Hymenobacter sp. 15J16-1T3B TaxID=2886941 RepID=UPI001D0FCDD8|nr:YraN family protein [Hymenobacter sp. 15J16-1T3B]MCC3155799.1 YraN family protein [Hymenobacter sp. 15J16-1T3B]
MPSPTLGAAGEQAAATYYQDRGYAVVARNYRHGRAEIDLIVEQAQPPRLVFVEVKVRTDLRYGFPEEFVTPAQQQRIRRAAEQFILHRDWQHDIRFDILSLTPNSQGFRIDAFEDAF